MYQPKTEQPCGCKKGMQRDNCSACEGTGLRIDFAKIRQEGKKWQTMPHTPGPLTIQRLLESIKDRISGDDLANIGFYDMENLIAEAPELLEAARRLIEHRKHDYLDNTSTPYIELVDAIAKAEGKD